MITSMWASSVAAASIAGWDAVCSSVRRGVSGSAGVSGGTGSSAPAEGSGRTESSAPTGVCSSASAAGGGGSVLPSSAVASAEAGSMVATISSASSQAVRRVGRRFFVGVCCIVFLLSFFPVSSFRIHIEIGREYALGGDKCLIGADGLPAPQGDFPSGGGFSRQGYFFCTIFLPICHTPKPPKRVERGKKILKKSARFYQEAPKWGVEGGREFREARK